MMSFWSLRVCASLSDIIIPSSCAETEHIRNSESKDITSFSSLFLDRSNGKPFPTVSFLAMSMKPRANSLYHLVSGMFSTASWHMTKDSTNSNAKVSGWKGHVRLWKEKIPKQVSAVCLVRQYFLWSKRTIFQRRGLKEAMDGRNTRGFPL